MALTRKYLQSLGLEDETVDKIITAHTEVTSALKDERDALKADAEKLTEVQKELESAKKLIPPEDGKNPWKVKYEAIKEEFDSFKTEIEVKKTAEAKTKAIKAMLKEIGISDKRIDAVAKVTDIDSIEIDSEGHIKDSDTLKESLKTEWSDFIPSESVKGADTPNPPTNTPTPTMTRKEIMSIKDTTERQKAIQDNHQLFGF